MRHQLNRLNALTGWQRLWLVASLIWLAVVLALASRGFPTEAKWRAETLTRAIEASTANKAATAEIPAWCLGQSEKSGDPLAYSHCMETHRILYQNSLARTREEEARIQEEGNLRISNTLLTEQLKYVGLAALLWVVPVSIAYLLGVAAAWISLGFRRDPHGGP
jgi:hypothetical protein